MSVQTLLDLLQKHDFSPERGFLPKQDPPKKICLLAGELSRFIRRVNQWEKAAQDLPDYLAQGVAREKIQSLPRLPVELISSFSYERAMLLCSYFGHAFVWGGDTPVPFVPQNIAVPWCKVSACLQRHPVLSYASYAMHNWKRIDPTGPIQLGNLALLQKFLGGFDESGFILVHVDIEAKAGGVGYALMEAYQATLEDKPDSVGECLHQAVIHLQRMNSTFQRMQKFCDPYIYYHRVRPYIHGWKDNPTFPDGIVYQGCFDGKPQKFRGETGAQSSIIPMFDAFLGIEHSQDQQDKLWHYLMEMREYMPLSHRLLLDLLEKQQQAVPLRTYVRERSELHEVYNQCVTQLYMFRETHRGYAKRYIEDQQEKMGNSTVVGTGGTPFSEYLKAHSENTLKALL